jgi:hypothetical protein
MATNGTSGKHGTNGKAISTKRKPSIKRTPIPKATAAEQRARREYLRQAGHTFSQEEIEKIRSQWVD